MGQGALSVATSRNGDRYVVQVAGELDMATADILRAAIATCPLGVWQCIVSLREVTFMDSSGLKVLLGERTRLRRRGQSLHLQDVPPHVTRLLQLAGVSERFAGGNEAEVSEEPDGLDEPDDPNRSN